MPSVTCEQSLHFLKLLLVPSGKTMALKWSGRHFQTNFKTTTSFCVLSETLQMPLDAYLTWKNSAKGYCQCPLGRPASCATEYDFTINTVDIFTLEQSALISCSANSRSPSIALVLQGYMGNAPYSPSYAVSLWTLEHYRILRLHKPSLSIEAFAKIPYVRTYRTVLSSTFDIYLTILREVEKRTKAALQHDLPNWWVLNACPACTYMLEDEPPLKFNRMYVFDGDSDYLLPHTIVDTFAGEVQPRSLLPDVTTPTEDKTPDTEDHLPVLSHASDSIAVDCSKNWKVAASDEKKRMWSIFDETGIFVSACCHGFILWYVDMVRSGELAKYPLAIITKVLELLGECSLGAYDIGCGFSSTVMASSLGPLFKKMDCCLCVDAFHGFAHNYRCQTKHHPLGIDGAGLEDFGTIECIFSASNALTPIIRYASTYNQHVFLDMFFKQWNDEKYVHLATMIYNNYCQAFQVISKESVALTEAMTSLGITKEDITLWHQEEEPPWDVHAMVSQCSSVSSRFISSAPNYQFQPPSQDSYAFKLSQTRKLETQRHYATEKLDAIQLELVVMEVKMVMCTREYQCALDNLQRLVIQHLFELQHLNVAKTAYKMRTQISKNLQTCCCAIQNAVKNPPCPPLEWAKVSHYQFLDEFTLLRETRQDIHNKPWAKPVIRETMRQHLCIQWAHEEVVHCNMEIRRLHTAIVDEGCHFSNILKDLEDAASPLLVTVHDFCQRQRLVNAQVLRHIFQVYAPEGFTGVATHGIRKGAPVTNDIEQDFPQLDVEEDVVDEDVEDDFLEDDTRADIRTLVEFVSDLPRSQL
ncbi:uncharacterized protein EDB91DRAFT_1235789 [Suillus paluster]|uniref:uncharacterized protein n=1 Tax=Suillus paluster TaxID=48578 RepID=UPI001B881123|nr:uncharacterized protein EDB91DRAFT_1235789 [Suillus paluster]KAG1747807.1 hypothetical protein EDB91DRAFT_1235789 [Suillus paluster]